MTRVTEFDNFRYNLLPKVMVSSGDIFQANADDLLGEIKDIKTYNDDILVLRKNILFNHIDQIRVICAMLCAAGLKDNAPDCRFELNEMTYLGYVITLDGIQHDPKKVQGIMDIGRTN